MDPHADTRQRIIATARDRFYARSYRDVGVAEICEQAGVLKGSFYHFFKSKQDLTLAVLEFTLLEAKENLLDRAFDPRIPPLQRLDRLAELSYALQQDRQDMAGCILGCPVGNLATELATQDEIIRQATARAFAKIQALIAATLEDAVSTGALPADTDIAATAQAMLAYYEGVLMLAKTQNTLETVRTLLPALRNIRISRPRN